jgi:hypothetical protein
MTPTTIRIDIKFTKQPPLDDPVIACAHPLFKAAPGFFRCSLDFNRSLFASDMLASLDPFNKITAGPIMFP